MKDEFNIEKDDNYSILIVRPFGKSTCRIRLPKIVVMGLIGIGSILIIGIIMAMFFVSKRSLNINEYRNLKLTTQTQNLKLKYFETEVEKIKKEMKTFIDRENNMRRKLGIKKKKNSSLYRQTGRKFLKAYKKETATETKDREVVLQLGINFLQASLSKIESSYQQFEKRVEYNNRRFEVTPSLWPTFGRILSNYGWRMHPKTGQLQFHKGIDIPSWIGAPIKTTAAGIVEFSGWGGGYGWLIIVAHEYGYRTMYAHLSETMVTKGRYVRKGQIIGKVGESGFTTGPHIHYEIRRWSRAINPKPYLGVGLLAASKRLW